jgi:ribosomal protein S18 acetylase RimI-like enzyme
MISLRKSHKAELKTFAEMELQPHAEAFINSVDLTRHDKDFETDNIIYLSIVNDNFELVGYFILAQEPDTNTIEFRRILIDQQQRGIGQIAIRKMESYCRENLSADRIWLDVYDDNHKGKHIYQKLGYQRFKEGEFEGRKLLYYQKTLKIKI